MRLVIQRCTAASVLVSEAVVGQIERGLVAFVGIEPRDTLDDVNWCAKKLANVKLFPALDESRAWKTSAKDRDFGILLVSQFTLFCKLKGSKPDFKGAAKAAAASELFDSLVAAVRREHGGRDESIATGQFGAMMQVNVNGDGPVTIMLDSQDVGFPRKHASPTAAAAAAAAEAAP